MSDVNATKKALAVSLKALMVSAPFEKISVGQICEACGMNRKSFYYHFRDKYDLVNWIFDTEFARFSGVEGATSFQNYAEFFEDICSYFYENRDFYRKVLRVKGQNSFSEHFQARLYPILQGWCNLVLEESCADEFYMDFLADATLCAIRRWLTGKDCMTAEELVYKLNCLIQGAARVILENAPVVM